MNVYFYYLEIYIHLLQVKKPWKPLKNQSLKEAHSWGFLGDAEKVLTQIYWFSYKTLHMLISLY